MEEISPPPGGTIPKVKEVEGEKDEETQEHIRLSQSSLEKILITGEGYPACNET